MSAIAESFAEFHMPEPNSGCWLWLGYCTDKGYGRFRRQRAHRVSYELHKGPITGGLWVLHKCDNPTCVNPDHLYLGNGKQNTQDMLSRDRQCRWDGRRVGSSNPRAKLNESQVREMRERMQTGMVTDAALAREYGVSETTVWHIRKRRTWANDE